jgi:hypothetical protein
LEYLKYIPWNYECFSGHGGQAENGEHLHHTPTICCSNVWPFQHTGKCKRCMLGPLCKKQLSVGEHSTHRGCPETTEQYISLATCGHRVSIKTHIYQVRRAGDGKERINPGCRSGWHSDKSRTPWRNWFSVGSNRAAGAGVHAEKLSCNVLFCVPAAETVHMKISRLILVIALIIISGGNLGVTVQSIMLFRDIVCIYISNGMSLL